MLSKVTLSAPPSGVSHTHSSSPMMEVAPFSVVAATMASSTALEPAANLSISNTPTGLEERERRNLMHDILSYTQALKVERDEGMS